MTVDAPDVRNPDGSTFNAPNDRRVTRVGKILRDFSIDEIVQFVNVITGQMSLVGPRPDLPDQVAHYSVEDRIRLTVKPGITGLAAIRGRNSLDWSERRALDNEYVKNARLLLDLEILVQTGIVVLMRRGVYIRQSKSDEGN